MNIPHRSHHPFDSIPSEEYDTEQQYKLTKFIQFLIGSLNWLATSIQPDITTTLNMLAKYMSKPSKGHVHAMKRIIRYLKEPKIEEYYFQQK